MIEVKVLVLGGDKKIVRLPEGSTVADALRDAGVGAAGMTCAVNGENAQLNTVLKHRQTVTVSNKVAGGR